MRDLHFEFAFHKPSAKLSMMEDIQIEPRDATTAPQFHRRWWIAWALFGWTGLTISTARRCRYSPRSLRDNCISATASFRIFLRRFRFLMPSPGFWVAFSSMWPVRAWVFP